MPTVSIQYGDEMFNSVIVEVAEEVVCLWSGWYGQRRDLVVSWLSSFEKRMHHSPTVYTLLLKMGKHGPDSSQYLVELLSLPHGQLGDGVGVVSELGTDHGVELPLDLLVGETIGVGEDVADVINGLSDESRPHLLL